MSPVLGRFCGATFYPMRMGSMCDLVPFLEQQIQVIHFVN